MRKCLTVNIDMSARAGAKRKSRILLVALVGHGDQVSSPELVTVAKESNSFGFGGLARSNRRFTARYSLLQRVQLFAAVVLDICTSIEAVFLNTNVQVTDVLLQLRFGAVRAVARLNAHLHVSLRPVRLQSRRMQ